MKYEEIAQRIDNEAEKYHLFMLHTEGFTMIRKDLAINLLTNLMTDFNIGITMYKNSFYKFKGIEYIKLVKSNY